MASVTPFDVRDGSTGDFFLVKLEPAAVIFDAHYKPNTSTYTFRETSSDHLLSSQSETIVALFKIKKLGNVLLEARPSEGMVRPSQSVALFIVSYYDTRPTTLPWLEIAIASDEGLINYDVDKDGLKNRWKEIESAEVSGHAECSRYHLKLGFRQYSGEPV